MDLRVPTLIKFLNRLKSGTAAGNKIYIKGNRRNNFRILKKVVYLVYYLKAILKRGTLNIQLRMNPNSYCLIMAGGIGNRFWPVSNRRCPKQFSALWKELYPSNLRTYFPDFPQSSYFYHHRRRI